MENFKLEGYVTIIPNLLYQGNDHHLIASRQKQSTKEQVVNRVIESAQWLVNIHDKAESYPEVVQISEVGVIEQTMAEIITDYDIISKIASSDAELYDFIKSCIPIDHNPGQEVLYLEFGKIHDDGIEMLNSYDDKHFKEQYGDESNIVDLASQLSEHSNFMDIVLGLENGELPCHGDLVYLIDEHGVEKSKTIKILKYQSFSSDVKLFLESLYNGVSSAQQIQSLYSSSHRDLSTTSMAVIENFNANYSNFIYKPVKKEDADLSELLKGIEGADKWNWGGNRGDG